MTAFAVRPVRTSRPPITMRDLGGAAGELIEARLEGGALRGPGRVLAHRLVPGLRQLEDARTHPL